MDDEICACVWSAPNSDVCRGDDRAAQVGEQLAIATAQLAAATAERDAAAAERDAATAERDAEVRNDSAPLKRMQRERGG